jgi:hypothetical protein
MCSLYDWQPPNHGTGYSSRIVTLKWDAWITPNQALHGHNQHSRTLTTPEKWLAVNNEGHIPTHVTHHPNRNSTGQRRITNYLHPITLPTMYLFHPHPNDPLRNFVNYVSSISSAPLTF